MLVDRRRNGAALPGERGAISVEYVIILVFVGLAVIVGATLLGQNISDELSEAGARVTSEIP